ncbi:MAG: alkaline phosphatase [Bacteroidales bacterium]|nr:alkaline phosphatase [Bacteroidales bacterium]
MKLRILTIAIAFSLSASGCFGMSELSVDLDNLVSLAETIDELENEESGSAAQEQEVLPKNVILVIGDGMGVAQVYSSIVLQGGDSSQFLRFPYTGFSRTYCLNRYTTDSGAGGTALVGGNKVNKSGISLSPSGVIHPSLFAKAAEKGLSTGFVVTSSVLDATPASTYAHVPERHMFDTISLQMSQCSHSVMIGGGRTNFRPENRKDGLSPIDTLTKRGYDVVYTMDSMLRSGSDKLCALLYEDYYPSYVTARDGMLTMGVLKALATLGRNPKGFALLVEGSQIDWACHNNDSAYLEGELRDFEQMLKAVLDFADHDGNTLVVVTADHETGGLTLKSGDIEKRQNNYSFSTGDHTGVMVPVFSYGPGSEYFTGIQQNTDIANKIIYLLGL